MMELLKQYFELQNKIYDYFGYVEDGVVIPLDDCTDCFWVIQDNEVGYSENEKEILDWINGEGGEELYVDSIYTQRFLPKWIYRTPDFMMVCCDPHTDGNKFLRVFDNTKEVSDTEDSPQ